MCFIIGAGEGNTSAGVAGAVLGLAGETGGLWDGDSQVRQGHSSSLCPCLWGNDTGCKKNQNSSSNQP